MKANETKIEEFLSTNKTRFVIPVYQRNYDWSEPQCKQLLDDILKAGCSDMLKPHFIGSIVYRSEEVPTSQIKNLIIIDGQQRLTTLTLIYLAIYHFAQEAENENLIAEILETYLINKFDNENNKLKLRATENNDKAIQYLLRNDANEEFKEFSKIIDNFDYFKSRINTENLQHLRDGLNKLTFVEIVLEKDDNSQRIFESLNSTGLELSQADLIRNYTLMDLESKDQQEIYNDYWKIIENLARNETSNESKVSDFIRDYLTLKNKKIPNKNKVYAEFKEKISMADLKDCKNNLNPIRSLAYFYNKLLNPKQETDASIRQQIQYINKLEINVAYPFLMQVYEDYANNQIDKAIFIEILELVQSFAWRRFIVGLPTNSLNKIFMVLYKEIDKNNYLKSLQKYLLTRSGNQRFPKNDEVLQYLKFKDVYNINSKNRSYLFERLENFNNKETVMIDGNKDITIEHIFPQNPDIAWKENLSGEDFKLIKDKYLHTIANLTLSGNNSKLSNQSFIKKRDLKDAGYKNSRLWLNQYLSELEKWDIESIEKRFNVLEKRFLQVWKIPDIALNDSNETQEVNIFDAEDPTGKKLEYAIFCGEKIEIKQITPLYVEIFKQLFAKQPEIFFTTDLKEKVTLTKESEKDDLRSANKINDSYYIESNIDSINKFDRIKYALELFNLQDELLIKYK